MIKVSVIIPTYCSGPRLDTALASIEAQTMPAEEIEIVLVDDGSPDNTFARLEEFAARRANVTIKQIENSGWPSRPRNIGVTLASGEYVLFMDHDDELFSDGLRAAYELGKANGADVVNGKEVRTGNTEWGMGVYVEDLPNAVGVVHPSPLLPMTPHKLYRREFLLDNQIGFPESRRHVWEDLYFNFAVSRHATVVSVLARTPFYHWVLDEHSASADYGDRLEVFWRSPEFWEQLERLLTYMCDQLDEPHCWQLRDELLIHQVRIRLLAYFTTGFTDPQRPAPDVALPMARDLLERFVPRQLDERFPARDRVLVELIRSGRIDQLVQVPQVSIVGRGQVVGLAWEGSVLHVRTIAHWSTDDGSDTGFVENPWRWPGQSEELAQATAQICVRSRIDHTVWLLDSRSRAEALEVGPDQLPVEVRVEGLLDVSAARFATGGVWDVTVRTDLAETVNQRAVSAQLPSAVGLVDGRVVIAYSNLGGHLSIDVGQWGRTVLADAMVAWDRAEFRRGRRRRFAFTIPIDDVAVVGETTLRGTLDLGGDRSRVRLVGRGSAAWLEGEVVLPRHETTGVFTFAGKQAGPPIRFTASGRTATAVPVDE